MRRVGGLAVAVVLGLGVGATAAISRSPSPSDIPNPNVAPAQRGYGGFGSTVTPDHPAPAAPAAPVAPVAPVGPVVPALSPIPPSDPLLLAWTSQPISSSAIDALGNDVTIARLTAARRDDIGLVRVDDSSGRRLDVRDGFEVPIDVLAYDPGSYVRFVPPASAAVFGELRDGQALLGASAARLRATGVGARLTFRGGVTVTVAAVVDDELVGAAEVAVTLSTGTQLGVNKIRYLLMSYRGSRGDAERSVTAALPGPIRFRGAGETPFLRNADAVLPLVLVKTMFGEFSYRSIDGRLEQQKLWGYINVVEIDVPVLGRVRCHSGVIAALRGAMSQLEKEHLGYLVDPSMSEVCWRLGRIHDEPRLTRQAWGIGMQLNNGRNPTGSGSAQDRRLIEIMQQWGFTWGGNWLIAEPSYFEYIGPPRT